jgi:hypothetical protein
VNVVNSQNYFRLRTVGSVLLTHNFADYKIEENEIGWACSSERKGMYRVLVRNIEGKRPLGRASRRR